MIELQYTLKQKNKKLIKFLKKINLIYFVKLLASIIKNPKYDTNASS